MDIEQIQKKLQSFVDDRDWDQFHSPKNIVMALSGEVGELVEIFQWLTKEQSEQIKNSDKKKISVAEEVADISIYLLRLCDKLDIDISAAIEDKIEKNEKKYPIERSKGISTKYDEI